VEAEQMAFDAMSQTDMALAEHADPR